MEPKWVFLAVPVQPLAHFWEVPISGRSLTWQCNVVSSVPQSGCYLIVSVWRSAMSSASEETWGRPRSDWRIHISQLALDHTGTLPEEQDMKGDVTVQIQPACQYSSIKYLLLYFNHNNTQTFFTNWYKRVQTTWTESTDLRGCKKEKTKQSKIQNEIKVIKREGINKTIKALKGWRQ